MICSNMNKIQRKGLKYCDLWYKLQSDAVFSEFLSVNLLPPLSQPLTDAHCGFYVFSHQYLGT